MTTTGTPTRRAGQGGPAAAPVPRRISRPRWLDPRILVGLVLVIASVVVGARVIGADRQLVGMWGTTRPLAAGTVLADGDLTVLPVNLQTAATAYVGADTAVAGRVLTVPMAAGQLLPVAAVQDAPAEGRAVSLAVAVTDMPPGVGHGSVVDIYLVRDGGPDGAQVELVAERVTVQTVQTPSGGGLSGAGTAGNQVTVQLAPDAADALAKVLPTGRPQLLLHTGG